MKKEIPHAMLFGNLIALSIVLTSCGLFNTGGNPTESVVEPAQAAATDIAEPGPPTSEPPPAAILTITPTHLPGAVDGANCIPPGSDPTARYDLPSIDTLQWMDIETSSRELRHLRGLSTYIWGLDPSPDGQWMILELVIKALAPGRPIRPSTLSTWTGRAIGSPTKADFPDVDDIFGYPTVAFSGLMMTADFLSPKAPDRRL